MLLLLLFSSVVWGQSDKVNDVIRVDFLDQSVKEITSGRPTITGLPTYINGIKFSNTSGDALTFQDATTQNSAAPSLSGGGVFTGVVTISGLTDTITASTHTLSGTPKCSGFSCDLLTLTPGELGTSYISIAGLPANSHIQIECSSCAWTTGTNRGWIAQVNGDSGANYSNLNMFVNVTSIGARAGASSNFWSITDLTDNNGSDGGQANDFILDLFTWKSGHTTGQSQQNFWDARQWDRSNSRYVRQFGTGQYTLIDSQINQITFQNSGGTNLSIGKFVVRIIQ